ncbi:MAG: hypothetical protein Q7S18_01540 [bacterium]|nr:hypothetical protein [bacterium]
MTLKTIDLDIVFCVFNIVIQKEKENSRFLTKRRIFLSLVFFVFAFGLFNFTNFSRSNKFLVNVWNFKLASAADAQQTVKLEDTFTPDQKKLNDRLNPGSPAQPVLDNLIKEGLNRVGAEIGDMLLWAFNAILTAIFKLTVAIVYIAAKLFDWSVDAKIFGLVMGLDAIKVGWAMVRDFLNMFFILVLLFSAFCTILQIEKYNIKKILLNLIIMALLVNFSFPIARFIIDAANIPMYYFFKATAASMGGSSVSDVILKNSGVGGGLENLMFPKSQGGIDLQNGSWALTLNLIAAIIFTFIFGMTLLIIAALLLIRIVVLALLIIFAPVGFAASILPGTKLASFAGEWWDALFKQAFFGPIMAFVLYIAIFMMGQMADITKSLSNSANSERGDILSSVIATGLSLSFPIIILWVGIMMAQKGAVGASAVSKKVTGWGKWAGNLPWRGTKALAGATGIPGGIKQRYGEIKDRFKSGRESREARIAAGLGSKSAEERDMKKRADEYKKSKSVAEMSALAKKGDAAAAYALADTKDIDQASYDEFMKTNKNEKIRKAVNSKVKQNRNDLVSINKANNLSAKDISDVKGSAPARAGWTDDQVKDFVATQEMGKLTAEKWADQDWVEIEKRPAGPDKTRIMNAAISAFGSMTPESKIELRKRISPANVQALTDMGVTI